MSIQKQDYGSNFKKQISKQTKQNASLKQRKTAYGNLFSEAYNTFKQTIAKDVLSAANAAEIGKLHTDWMDQWIAFTWWFVVAEQKMLMKDALKTGMQKKAYLEKTIPSKLIKHKEITHLLTDVEDQSVGMDPAEKSYYTNQLKDLEKEIEDLKQELELLKDLGDSTQIKEIPEETLLEHFSIFARGGYGRTELTFSSDIDLGYCIELKDASGLVVLAIQELLRRMEDLFQEIPLDSASQYFELGEDLSRFGRTDMLHTIPSILEGRRILGNTSVLKKLKEEFLRICPPEKAIRYLKKQMDALNIKGNDTLHIKEGYGGIRHLQYVLWMVLIVENSEISNTTDLLDYLTSKKWITAHDRQNLSNILEFYFDLRNFIGLYQFYSEQLKQVDYDKVLVGRKVKKDFLDSTVTMAYLKLKNRFVTIDYMDRFRLHAVATVSSLAQSIVRDMLNHTVTEEFPGFSLVKHLGSNTIIDLRPFEKKPRSAWNISEVVERRKKTLEDIQKESFKQLFVDVENIFTLFLYIAKTGNKLSRVLLDGFCSIVEELYNQIDLAKYPQTRQFIFDLFIAENASIAIQQMMDISCPISRDGHLMTLLGLFIPETNQMRYLLRNLDVHEFPVCIHSLKALGQVEKEIESSQKNESELWRFVSEKDIFSLKWSTLFHDIGKINPYRNHEKLGPVISTDMLKRLGWPEQDEVMEMVRLLIANHQSVVRFSQLSTYLDLGILKFFELAQRDPRKVLLLYLINLSDFKSVNSEMRGKAAHLESFFEKTMSILGEFKLDHLSGSLTDLVNNYLDRTVDEKRTSVLLELLLRQCCNKNLEDVIVTPLMKMSETEARELGNHQDELENSLVFLKLAELDEASLAKHRFRFTQIIQQVISERNVLSIAAPLSKSWNWFFTTIPNRYLLSTSVEVLSTQLQDFESDQDKNIRLSYVKGEKGEYDSILFHFTGDPAIQSRIAYALSWQGVNIENGKINKVIYADKTEGFMGYFRISMGEKRDRLSRIELENVIDNLILPPLNPLPVGTKKNLSTVQMNSFLEKEKGYLVKEVKKDSFKRVSAQFEAVKISLFDAPFVYYKILRSFEAIGVAPQQVTITTIGNQIIDYFYISTKDKKLIQENDFDSVLQKYINAEIEVD